MDMSTGQEIEELALSGVLAIDLAALKRNYRRLASMVYPSLCGAVVKADAYGLGAAHVAPVLADAGCRTFFVAHLLEARNLKRYLPQDARIVVLNGILPGGEAYAAAKGIVPVINSLEQLRRWRSASNECGRRLPAVLQFDTGMSRLGMSKADARALLADPDLLSSLDIQFIMSHLASADESVSPQNADQRHEMQAIAAAFSTYPVSFGNSGGIFLGADFHGSLVRPGIALYGGLPTDAAMNPLEPVVRLSVRVIQTHTVEAGARVGYGGAQHITAPTRLATLAAGYADGLPRSLSGRGSAYFGDRRLPIVGRVSMDSMTIDITSLPEDALSLGSLVEIIGPHQSLEDVARDAGTISYEILTGLGRRYHRQYH